MTGEPVGETPPRAGEPRPSVADDAAGDAEPSPLPVLAAADAPPDAERWEPDPDDRRLHASVVWLWRVSLVVRTVAWTAALALLGPATPFDLPWPAIAGALAGVGAGATLVWPRARYRRWRFRMRERDLMVRHGVLWRTVSLVPYSRIQHVDTRRGPLERYLGIASLIVYTAGVRGADVEIPGLDADEAEALRERLAALGGTEDAV